MSEKNPKSQTEKAETGDKSKDITAAILSPDEKTEGFEETGYGSAPGSFDVTSGAESSIWTSDDHAPEELKSQEAISEATSSGLETETKPSGVIKKPTNRRPKLGFFKKASPVGKLVKSNAELTENLIPPQEEDKTKHSSSQTKSRSKFTSVLPRLVSLKKTRTYKPHSHSLGKKEKDSKYSPKKSPVNKLSGIPTSVRPKNPSLAISSDKEEHAHGTKKEMSVKSHRSTKRESSPSKPKSSVQATSTYKPSEVSTQAADTENAGECSVKPKRAPKFSLRKFKTNKKVATAGISQSSAIEVKSDAPSATSSAYELVRKGFKKMDVSGKLKKSTKKSEETCLIEKDKKAEKARTKHGEDESSEDRSLNAPHIFKETSWKPVHSNQQGGLLDEDMFVCIASSEKDTTPTEMSTLSDSSSWIGCKSRSPRLRHRTIDSQSKFSSFEEEVEEAARSEYNMRPQLQRQINVTDLEMDDSGDVFDSPDHEVTPKNESENKNEQ